MAGDDEAADAIEESAFVWVVGETDNRGCRGDALIAETPGPRDEGFGVLDFVAGQFHSGGIATGLTFDANLATDPPNGRVEEQQRLDDHLAEVDEIVEPADVGQFVREDGAQIVGRDTAEHRGRQEQRGPQAADHAGDGQALTDCHANAPADAHRSAQLLDQGKCCGVFQGHALSTQTVAGQDDGQGPRQHGEYTE